MNHRKFLSVVPKPVQFWALAIAICGLLIGSIVSYIAISRGAPSCTMFAYGTAGLFMGIMTAAWLLCLGYVYADARQRAMPAVLWTLVAILVPNLLGFLLYFVIRKPLTIPCPNCHRPISPDQTFCSWCGTAQYRPPSSNTPPYSNPSGLDSINTP